MTGPGSTLRATTAPHPNETGRLFWADNARGIAIVLVVVGHTLSGASGSGVLLSKGAAEAYDTIYSFHMAVFFVVSGMFLRRSRVHAAFFENKFRTLLYPYILWSGLHGIAGSCLAGSMNTPVTFTQMATGLLSTPIAQLWFLPTLFILSCFIGLAARWRIDDRVLLLIVAGFWSLVYCPVVFASIGMLLRSVSRFGIYVIGGLLVGERPLWSRVPRLVLSVGAILSVAVVWGVRTWPADPLLGIVPAVLGILAVLALGVALGNHCRPLQRLGSWSLPIYLGHVAAAAATRVALLKLGVIAPTVHLPLGVLAGVGAPAVLGWLRDRGRIEFLFTPPGWTLPRVTPRVRVS